MLHTLTRSLRENKGPALVTVLLSALEVVFEIVIPLFMSNLIDFGIEGGSMAAVWRFGAFLLLLAAFQLATGVLAARIAARASVGFAANLREDMYNNVQTFAFSNIDKFSTASIVTRLTTDTTNVQNAFQMLMRMAIRAPVMLIFSMIVSFRISHDISMTFLIILPILALALFFIIRSVFPVFSRVFRTYDELNNVVQENVRGIRVVKSFNQERHEIGKFGAISERIYKDFSKGERLITLNAPLMQFCIYTCMIVISWLGAKAIIASGNDPALGLTTGNLTALITYTMQILSSLMMLSMVFAMLTISLSSARRIAEVLEERSDIPQPEQPVMTVRDGAVDFDHVSFVYASKADKKVLDDIDLHIRSGETIGIIGGTGASKSSLVQLIPRLYDVTGGKLTLGGVDVRDYDLDTLRGAVAMVLQKNELFSGTIAENLRWGNENATDEQLRHACKLACADGFISAMTDGYDTHIEQGGTNVSGGQKQRLCIARALLKKPKVLILDDSTSAVDTRTDAQIQQALSDLHSRTRRRSSSRSASARYRMQTASSCSTTGVSTLSAATMSCCARAKFTARSMSPSRREARTMRERPKFDGRTLKRLLSYMRAYKGTLVLVTVCILLSAVAGAASSMFLQKLIDGYIVPMLGTASPDYSGLIRALITIGCVYLVGTLATWLYNRRMVTIAQGTLKRIRDEMFAKMQSLPIRYFDTHTHGDIMSLYTNDTDTLRQMIAQSMAQLVSSVFTLDGQCFSACCTSASG